VGLLVGALTRSSVAAGQTPASPTAAATQSIGH
jgi:hypothetical protein